jgi:segregation and condensation protein A
LECKTFKDASLCLSRLMEAAERSVARCAGLEEPFIGLTPDPLDGVRPEQLRRAMVKLLAPKPAVVVNTDHVAPVRASVADTLEDLLDVLPSERQTTFRLLTAGLQERLEVIVYFLALLELYKRGMVDLEQGGKLAELHVRWLGEAGGTPAGGRLIAAAAGSPGDDARRLDEPVVLDEYQG